MAQGVNLSVVRAALAAIHAPATTNDARHGANAALAQFMATLPPNDAFQAAHTLLLPLTQGQPLTSDAETLFGFQLLDEKILRVPPWMGHSPELRAEVRKLAVALVSHASPRHYKQYVVSKSAALVVGLAIREWPQQWPTFVDDLVGGSLPHQVVCEVLRILSEEVHEFFGAIESARRTDLTQEMARALPKMLTYITAAANHFVQHADSPGLSAAIMAIEAFVTWAPPADIFTAGFPNACISLLQNAEFKAKALSALMVLVVRKDVRGDTTTHPGFREQVFPQLLEYIATGPLASIQALSYTRPAGLLPGALPAFERCSFRQEPSLLDVDVDQHEFNVTFMSMFAKLGVTHFLTSFVPPDGQENANAPTHNVARAFIDVMVSAVASPSVAIRTAVLPFFSHIMGAFGKALEKKKIIELLPDLNRRSGGGGGHSKLLMDGFGTAFVQEIMESIVRRFVNAASLAMTNWPNDGLRNAYEEIEYGCDSSQLTDQIFALKGRTVNNIGLAARLLPNAILPLALARLMDILGKANSIVWTSAPPASEVVKGKLPYVLGFITEEQTPRSWTFGNFVPTQSKEMEAALEAAVLSTEAVLAGISATRLLETDPASYKLLENLFQVIMGLTHPNLAAAKITSLRMFIPIFKKDPQALQLSLQTLVTIIEGSKTSSTSLQACNSLASICRRLRRTKTGGLHAFLSPLCTFAVRAQDDAEYGLAQRNLLLEAAIAVTLSGGTPAEQTPIIESLLQPLFSVLEKSRLKSIHEPEPLFNFMETAPESKRTFACLRSLEAASHQVVRVHRHMTGTVALQTPLSSGVAPWIVKVAAPLVTAIHGLYNPNLFPLAGQDKKRTSILLPTSREIAYLLNLDGNTSTAAWNNSPISGSFGDGNEAGEQNGVKSALERSDDLLSRYDIVPPDSQFAEEREYLKGSRFAAYECLRAAILSGICQSHMQTTLVELLNAVCSHCQFLEPIHLHYLLNKVLRHLLSFQVTVDNGAFLAVVNQSQVPELLKIVGKSIETLNAHSDESVSSSVASLDVARDHGRKMVARSAADVLVAMYPKEIARIPSTQYLPPALGYAQLAESLGKIWDVLCQPGRGVSNNGGSRIALQLLSRAVDCAPPNASPLFLSRLEKCLSTAAQSDGMGSDSPMEPAISALLSYFRKWPEDSVKEISRILGNMPQEFLAGVSKKLDDIIRSSMAKQSRSKLRSLVKQISQKAGLSVRKQASVRALPRQRRPRAMQVTSDMARDDSTEVVLGDRALDALFNNGGPL